MRAPFQIFSWRRPFLPGLKAHILRVTNNHPGRALIIVPNQRPWRYFTRLFEADGKITMLPRMLPIAKSFELWRKHVAPQPLRLASILDQAALCWELTREQAQADAKLAASLAQMDLSRFLPWGLRLAAILDEIATQQLPNRDLAAPEGEVEPFADALLASLGKLGARWKTFLPERNFTTPGLDAALAAENADRIPPALLPAEERQVFIAGFSALNGAESKIIAALWQAGAQICLHSDPALVSGGSAHWACADHAAWIKNWHVSATLATDPSDNQPQYSFYAGYDVHSQLLQLAADLPAAAPSAAIVLPNPDLLMPVLHHLPQKDVNISMGYPLKRAPLRALIAAIFEARLRKAPPGLLHWRDLRLILQHPLIAMLVAADGASIKPILAQMDILIRNGGKFVDPGAIAAQCQATLPEQERALLAELLERVFDGPAQAQTPGQLAQALASLCDFLSARGEAALQNGSLDAEAIARLRDAVIPALSFCQFRDEIFEPRTLYAILTMLMDGERIPFEADPLVGLQILGMLETRLLHFDELFILDACDELLPGADARDPLLPDNLRAPLGLPDRRQRESVMAYNLFRLCLGAQKVHFYWPEGSAPAGAQSTRTRRSRFVERLIWEMEQKNGAILEPGQAPLCAATSSAQLLALKPRALPRSPSLSAALSRLLRGKISAKMLSEYLGCPLRFAQCRLLGLRPLPNVTEGEDPQATGTWAHAIFNNLLAPYLGKKPFAVNNLGAIRARAAAECARAPEPGKLSPPAQIYFDFAAPRIVDNYLRAQGEQCADTTILKVEQTMSARIAFGNRNYLFEGRIDRIDERGGQIIIVDYKTGASKKFSPAIWQDDELFECLRAACADAQYMRAHGDEHLQRLRQDLPDAQLILYMLLVAQDLAPANAVFIYPGAEVKDMEAALFDDSIEPAARLTLCRDIIAFLLSHLENCVEFSAAAPESCKICDFRTFCGV